MILEHLDKQTADGTAQNLGKLYQLFPSCFTETADAEGNVKRAIDWGKLRELLGDNVAEDAPEVYDFTWVGKRAAQREAMAPIRKTLRPCPEESVNWDTTQNLYIEGDNLEVLKLLQNSYMGKVKMIYIDPPYNTGNDFVYQDDFHRTQREEDEEAGVFNEEGERMVKNTESNGKFHSDWCSMIYSRLMVARSLLKDDGVIFISIDENEIENLKKICNEVFGAVNHINTITLNMSNMSGPKVQHAINGKRFPKIKEYLLLYCKNSNSYKLKIPKEKKQTWDNEYNLIIPELSRGLIQKILEMDIKIANEIVSSFTIESLSAFMRQNSINDSIEWKEDNSYRIFASKPNTALLKKASELSFDYPLAIINNSSGQNKLIKTDFNRDTRTARIELANAEINSSSFFGDHWTDIVTTGGIGQEGNVPFENGKKPLKLLDRLARTVCNDNDIILDFFSGSATTAHAIMQLNTEDSGNRKFIMVQWPEECDVDSEAYKAGYKNICEIGKERIRRAGKKIKEDSPLTTQDLDIGFRVFKCDDSNYKDVAFAPKDYSQESLDLFVDNIKENRTDLDLLFDCMLRWGVTLDLPMTKKKVDGCTIHNVNEGALVACFDGKVTEAVIDAIAEMYPAKVVFRDSSFEEAAQKMNIFELFKQKCGWDEQEVKNNVRVI